ncbi:hypothetical protein JL722_8753 [Aureococcus anophagefferens]|nr:hypothetical protein JL722_8753 [Aureococcus anophagefferens]
MSTQRLRVAAAAAAGAAATYALARFLRWYDSDDAWLALADRIRASLPPPSQSSFRVVAVVTLVGGGTSSSPLSLAPTEVACVYIVCDASRPITPGLLCREFMYSSPFCEPATRVVTASPGLRVRIETSLAELLPRASPYARLNAREQKEWALSRTLELGVARAFAAGRAFLCEHGHGDVEVVFHDDRGAIGTCPASDLAPAPPEFEAADFVAK